MNTAATRLVKRLGCLAVAFIIFAIDGPVRAQEQTRPEPEAEIVTAPVELDGAELFRVRGVSSFPAEARAARIRERLKAAAADPNLPVTALRLVESADSTQIVADHTTLVTLVEADAAVEQVRRATLAAAHLARIRRAILEYRAARSTVALRGSALATIVGTLFFGVAAVLLHWFSRWIDHSLASRLQTRIHAVEIQSFQVMRADRIWNALTSAFRLLRNFTYLALAFVYVGFVLAQWPATRGVSRRMGVFMMDPLRVLGDGIVASIPSLIFLIVLFLVVRLTMRLARVFFDALARGTITFSGFEPEWAAPTYKIVRVAIVVFGLIVAYPYIPGSSSAAFKGVSLFLGIVVSLGSSSAISNIIAGYMMTYRRAFRMGDRVKIGNTIGTVIETRIQVTHLRSPKNEELIIPNSQILTSEVCNYSSLARTSGLIIHTEVGIGYETPWRQVEAMLVAAAERTPGLRSEPPPFVHVKQLGDFAVVYELNAYCETVQSILELYAALHRNILDLFNEFGVQIMTPAYEGDPDTPKIVARKDWYMAPAAAPTESSTVISWPQPERTSPPKSGSSAP